MSGESPAVVLYDLNGVPLVGAAGTGSAAIITIQGNASGTPVPVSGTVTAANASVSTTASVAPGSATLAGALVTTSVQSGLTATDMYSLNMTTTGLLRVDGSNVTQPVSGTITANAGTGSFTVAQPTAANLNATVVGSGNFTVVQPTAASLNATVVGTGTGGAVTVAQTTAANLNATIVGTTAAGSGASSGLITIQGNASGTPIPVTSSFADLTATGALGALNANVQITTAGYNSIGMQLAAGTLIGTLVAETSFDNGTTWNSTLFNDVTTSSNNATIVFASSNVATAKTLVGVGGTGLMRVRVSAYTSGTANVTLRASEVRDPSTLNGGPAAGTLPPTISQVGGSVTTSSPTYTNGTLNAISLTTAGAIRIDGSAVTQPVSGTITANAGTGSFTVVQATAANLNATIIGTTAAGSGASSGLVTIQGNASGTPIPVSGTVNATNASVSTVAATPPTSATYAGASVTTAAPTYTTGQMDPLSLTTGGLLRIDGVYPINTTTPTTDISFIGGAVTTSAPSYTTGQLSALSLTTVGNLRVDGSSVTQPVSGTVTANAGTGSFTVAQPTAANLNATVVQATAASLNATVVQATAANLNATIVGTTAAGSGASSGLVTIQGNASGTPIPISGTFTTDKSSTGTLTSVAGSATSVSLLASNSSRISATFWNESTSKAYIALSATSSTTAYTIQLLPNSYYELSLAYTGAVSAIWSSATGSMRISEMT